MLLDQRGESATWLPMREKLLEILEEESIPDERANFLAAAMVRDLRCENCKHYLGQDVPYMAGNCSKSVSMNPAGCVDPDFFCALFEQKP